MPQKKNPDACELMRGKTGRVVGSLMSLLVVLKGLPMTYNRDLQEDKEPFFDADKTVSASLGIMKGMLEQLEFVPEKMLATVERGSSMPLNWLITWPLKVFHSARRITLPVLLWLLPRARALVWKK